jgi:hypothetical protein
MRAAGRRMHFAARSASGTADEERIGVIFLGCTGAAQAAPDGKESEERFLASLGMTMFFFNGVERTMLSFCGLAQVRILALRTDK